MVKIYEAVVQVSPVMNAMEKNGNYFFQNVMDQIKCDIFKRENHLCALQ